MYRIKDVSCTSCPPLLIVFSDSPTRSLRLAVLFRLRLLRAAPAAAVIEGVPPRGLLQRADASANLKGKAAFNTPAEGKRNEQRFTVIQALVRLCDFALAPFDSSRARHARASRSRDETHARGLERSTRGRARRAFDAPAAGDRGDAARD